MTTTQEKRRPLVLSASTVIGDDVVNGAGEKLGKIEEVVLDVDDDRIAYAVLSFGGVFGLGDKLFAIPWDALVLDHENKRFVLDVPREKLEAAPGFSKDDWPDFADRSFGGRIHAYYDTPPYWS
jgi:sporulation protein YlmC with PRC-barrel domain